MNVGRVKMVVGKFYAACHDLVIWRLSINSSSWYYSCVRGGIGWGADGLGKVCRPVFLLIYRKVLLLGHLAVILSSST